MIKKFRLLLLKINFRQTAYIIPLIIFLVAFILRFYQFEERFEWTGNQSHFAWEIKQLTDGHLTLVGFDAAAIGNLRFPPFLLYFLAPLFIIFKGHPLGIDALLIILGAVTSVAFYFIGKMVFDKNIAIISAIIYTFSLRAIIVDRKFMPTTFMVIFSLLAIGYLYRLLQAKALRFSQMFILGTILGLGFSIHYQAFFILFVTIIILFWQRKLRLFSKNFVVLFVTIGFWLSPLLFFDFRHDFFTLKGLFLLHGSYTQGPTVSGFVQSAEYILGNFLALIWQPGYLLNYQKIIGVIPTILLTLLLIFYPLFIVVPKKSKILSVYFVLLSLFGFLTYSFYKRGSYNFDYYYRFLIPVFVFAIALTINKLLKAKIALIVLFLLAFILLNIKLIISYKAPDSYKLFKSAVNTILVDSQNQPDEKIVVKFFGIPPTQIDYLFYVQSKNFDISPEKIILISDEDLFQERVFAKSQPPITILSKSKGKSESPHYLFERSVEARKDYLLLYNSERYRVYRLI